jgi:hypothetical protein
VDGSPGSASPHAVESATGNAVDTVTHSAIGIVRERTTATRPDTRRNTALVARFIPHLARHAGRRDTRLRT